jgi:phospholipid/cholesterol/gamma-HCH transport system substrate-binding protein
MASRVHWRDLRIGLAAVVTIVVIVFSILIFARVGALHGEKKKLYVTAPDVTGVLPGTEVWVAGKLVGQVADVRFRGVTSDTLQRVLIETDILTEMFPLIRKDSRASVGPGGTLIGSPVVFIKPGTLRAAPVKEGDTIQSAKSSRIAAVGSQIDTLVNDLATLGNSSGKLVDQLGDPTNTVGALRTRGMQQLGKFSGVISSFTERATRGNGTLGLAYRSDGGTRIRRVLAAKDSIMFLVSSGNGTVGRFRRDSTLKREITSVRAGVDSLRRMMSTPGNSVSKLRSDTTLKSEMARARAQIDSVMQDIKKHPKKYISF